MLKRLLPAAILIMGLLYIFLLHSIPFKLIPMALILIYGYLRAPAAKSKYVWLTLSGLFFCMMGDGLIQWFLIGLSAFLVGHLFYLSAFTIRWTFSRVRIISIIPIACFASYMAWKLFHSLQSSGNDGLILPVMLYLIVISLMGFFAIMSGNLPASCGAVLFMASDSILSWNMFISDIKYSDVWIMTTYYAAQFLIASSIGYKARLSGKENDNYRELQV
ncbi:lysoplasmalogenase [Paenibacillus sp. KQZ6P-2]|uniref:Lysoplasmalogenase n=1 Tax=Paenibacillus mangrovi TaxID=2931978 RepID=A0A9X1WKU8_9BACL|nr:lysoplasmalogenase [Paenibacillus mangrovi]MCJ8010361.1 lysoplasmalogenase [Paenibacillus mangrovi]